MRWDRQSQFVINSKDFVIAGFVILGFVIAGFVSTYFTVIRPARFSNVVCYNGVFILAGYP